MTETLAVQYAGLQKLIAESRNSPRRRTHIILRKAIDGSPGIMANVLQPGTYVRPHMHPDSEVYVMMQGELGVILFDTNGRSDEGHKIKALEGHLLIPGRTYHTAIALEPDSVLIEIYGGHFREETYKTFAPWSPEEGAEGVAQFIRNLERQFQEQG